MLLLHLFLTLPIEVYPATNVRKNFVITKFWQIFILSHSLPLPPLQWDQKPCTIKFLTGTILPMHLTNICKSEKLKKKKLKFVNENYIYCS